MVTIPYIVTSSNVTSLAQSFTPDTSLSPCFQKKRIIDSYSSTQEARVKPCLRCALAAQESMQRTMCMHYRNIPRFVMKPSLVLRFAIALPVRYKWWVPQSTQEATVKRCIHSARNQTRVRKLQKKTIVKIKVIKTKVKRFWMEGAEERQTEERKEAKEE